MGGRFCRHAMGTCTATNAEYQATASRAPAREHVHVHTREAREERAMAVAYLRLAGYPDAAHDIEQGCHLPERPEPIEWR